MPFYAVTFWDNGNKLTIEYDSDSPGDLTIEAEHEDGRVVHFDLETKEFTKGLSTFLDYNSEADFG